MENPGAMSFLLQVCILLDNVFPTCYGFYRINLINPLHWLHRGSCRLSCQFPLLDRVSVLSSMAAFQDPRSSMGTVLSTLACEDSCIGGVG